MSLIKKQQSITAEQLAQYEQIQVMMEHIDDIMGTIPENLQKLNELYEDALLHKSSDALRVRFEIIKYINELRGLKIEKESRPINIAIFNNYDKGEDLKF